MKAIKICETLYFFFFFLILMDIIGYCRRREIIRVTRAQLRYLDDTAEIITHPKKKRNVDDFRSCLRRNDGIGSL